MQINVLSDNPKPRVKQPKVTTTPPTAPAPAILRGPRYRYFSTTPAKVTLRMRDLQVPEKARTAAYDSEQFVELPCEDIFRGGPVPKIRLARLAELAPGCVMAADLPDEGIKLCSARLALAYVVTEGRELIEEPPAPELPPLPPPVLEEFTPPTAAKKNSEQARSGPAAPGVTEKPKDGKIEPPKLAAEDAPAPPGSEFRPRRRWLEAYRARMKSAPPAADEKPAPTAEPSPKPPEAPAKPEAEIKPAAGTPAPEPSASEIPPPAAKSSFEPSKSLEPKPQKPAPKPESPASMPAPMEARKPFSLFPKFRRKEGEEPKPSVVVPRSRIEIPKPKRPAAPLTAPPIAPLPGDTTSAAFPAPPLPAEPASMASIPPPAAMPPLEPSKTFQPNPPVPVSKPGIPAPAVEPPPAAEPPPAPKPPVEAEKIVEPERPAPAPAPEPPAPSPAPAATKLPPPPPALTPPVTAVPPAPPAATSAATPAVTPAVIERPPALLVETEHLAKEQDRPEIAGQDTLQAIFHTEEFLSVDRVLELCGNLPGIRSCVLSSGANVIASHNAPDSVDIVSLSAHALEMIKSMRSSAAKMGIGAVPAVTVHSEKGPITFFHQDDLCLLVLHQDRGFIPGVREKLQQVVTELSEAKLPLRLGQGPGKKMLRS